MRARIMPAQQSHRKWLVGERSASPQKGTDCVIGRPEGMRIRTGDIVAARAVAGEPATEVSTFVV